LNYNLEYIFVISDTTPGLTNMAKKTYYSFMYCTLHDQCFIVSGEHRYSLPSHFKNTVCHGSCENCDWTNKGIVSIDGILVNIVKPVETNYNEQCGGNFEFNMISDILDENGDELEMNNDSPFKIWLNKIQTLTKNNNKI
jgi:hypothetical protein